MMDEFVAKICEKAKNGDIKSLDWLISVSADIAKKRAEDDAVIVPDAPYAGLPAHLIGSDFLDITRDIRERRHKFYNFKGGRGSLKSSFCALVLVDEILRNKNFCAIALRQVKDTLKTSVYAQIQWAIDMMGLSELFEFTTHPLQIKKKDTGQVIYFRGCAVPSKIKSIRPPKGMHIGIIWFEEKDQLHGGEAVRSVLQSVMRGDDNIIVLSSYNTPRSRRHFLNQEELIRDERAISHHSFYYNAPRQWLGQPFFDEAEQLKKINPKAYEHEYLGRAIGNSGSVFENVEVREILQHERSAFERYYYGVDWGYYPDPWAFVKCAYSAKDRVLYVLDEAYEHKKSNSETAHILLNEKKLTDLNRQDMLICDSSEPKSIAEYAKLGLRAMGAEKGAISGGRGGSVDYSMRWLQRLTKIVISSACAQTAKEFQEYEYEKDKNGEVISGYPDKDNHLIDAVRYASTMLWRRQ